MTATSNQRKIPAIAIDQPQASFTKFIENDSNRRILFSGQYGIGKTYFLESFFKENEAEYDAYHLFPVRYEILANQNIFDFIRSDLFVAIEQKYPEAFKSTNPKTKIFKRLKTVLKNEPVRQQLLNIIPKVGHPIGETVTLIQKIKKVNFDEALESTIKNS